MNKNELRLMQEFKRLIHLLSVGKRKAIDFDGVSLYRAEIHVLEIISMKESTTVTEVADMLTVTRGAISQTISKLFSKGLISKTEKDITNKVMISLTPKGVSVIESHAAREKLLLKSIKKSLKSVSPEDIGVFSEVISNISDFIRRE